MNKQILYLGLDPSYYDSDGIVTHWPIIKILPRPLSDSALHQALLAFATYTHVIITSKTTVKILNEYLTLLGFDSFRWLNKIVITVGKTTARHFASFQCKKMFVAENETAEGIIQILEHLPLEKAHLFWAHSSQARPVISKFLNRQEVQFTDCILYDPKPIDVQEKLSLEKFDEIVFTSPSTVDAFRSIFGSLPKDILLKPIGPITAQYLQMQI